MIIEDSEDDCLLIVMELKRNGFDVSFKRTDTKEGMEDLLAKENWDIVISDYQMPQFNGFEALEVFKKKNIDIPFIIVSGKIGEELAVSAMRKGACDYILKQNLIRLAPAVKRELQEASERREKRRLEAKKRLFERMVSPSIIENLDPDNLPLKGTLLPITILFADIRGFTSFSEKKSPEDVFLFLNRFLAPASDCILKEGGTIDKFMGDGIMAYFNAPLPQKDHIFRSIVAALNIQSLTLELYREFPESSSLSFGIGIHSGEAALGLLGIGKHIEYTAIGDCVNIGKRIEENAKGGEILLSKEAYNEVKERVVVKDKLCILPKGKTTPQEVYEIIGIR
ncbi:MAG: adenylate/guanylate cyclase domain-containing protein [bacterium]